jgi:hypothetical protein
MAREEEFLAFPMPRERVPLATAFRSTWLTSSIASLREHGVFERYERLLSPKAHDDVLSAVAGVWLPMETALEHYSACDRLDLPTETMLAIGEAATRRANGTSFQFAARVAAGAGVSPWTIFAQAHRFWGTTCQGGAMAIYKLGPKEARIEIEGFPLARYRYNVVTMRGITQAAAKVFCDRAFARDIPSRCGPTQIALRVSWV